MVENKNKHKKYTDQNAVSMVQKRKLVFCVIVIISAVAFIGATFAGTNAVQSYKSEQLTKKKNDINNKKQSIQKINDALSILDKNSLDDKNLNVKFYTGVNEEVIINKLKIMILGDDNNKKNNKNDKKEEENKNNVNNKNNSKEEKEEQVSDNKDFSNLKIDIKGASSSMVNAIKKTISSLNITKEQDLSVDVKANVVTVSITSDYEFSIYQIYGALKQYLPGYVSLLSFSVMPVKEEIQDILYDLKFSNKKKIDKIDNRFNSKVEVLWFYLKK